MNRCFIYVLIDPRNETIFYVGQTHRGECEPLGWIYCGHKKGNNKFRAKLKSLRNKGLKATWEILEEIESEDQLDEVEIFWIANFRAAGADLTNHANGGRSGNRHLKHSAESKKRMAAGTKAAMARDDVRKNFLEAAKLAGEKRRGRKQSTVTRKLQSERARISQNSDSQKKLLIQNAKSQWADPIQRELKLTGIRRYHKRRSIRCMLRKFDRKTWAKLLIG